MITLSDVLKAYEQFATEPDEPDYIVLPNGRCPVCKSEWPVSEVSCVHCGFPDAAPQGHI